MSPSVTTTSETPAFTLDPSYQRPRGGAVVVAGSPLRLFRLGAAGIRIVEALERGGALPDGHEPLTDRLVAAGAIHPAAMAPALDAAQLTVVVPAYGEMPRFRPHRCAAIVVDDASPTPLRSEPGPDEPAGDDRRRLLRLEVNRGPGVARNAGLAEVRTAYVAFVDTDVDVDEGALCRLAGQLDAWGAALVAPRVVADEPRPDASVLARFERAHSPLDLGPVPGRVQPTTRVSFVPAAVIVCRTDAIREIGGFDESMRFGEDVDLVWRLHERGFRCRYEPTTSVAHRTRAGWRAWVRQRFQYGTSAAPLARRHRGALAPVRMSGWSAAAWAAVALGHPLAGVAIGAGTTAALVRKLRDVPVSTSIRLAGVGHLYAGDLIAGTVVRPWWPISALAAIASRRARWVLVASVAVVATAEARRHRGTLDPVRAGLLRLTDDVAYGAGVWVGMWHERTFAPVVPVLSSWPGRCADR